MRQEVYNFKLNGVLRERMTVDAKQPIVTLEMFAHDGRLMHTEWTVEGKDGQIREYKPKRGGLKYSGFEDRYGNAADVDENGNPVARCTACQRRLCGGLCKHCNAPGIPYSRQPNQNA